MDELPVCKFCRSAISEMWWKCCLKHTTAQGKDVVCDSCKKTLHPICGILTPSGWGQQKVCGYPREDCPEHGSSWKRNEIRLLVDRAGLTHG